MTAPAKRQKGSLWQQAVSTETEKGYNITRKSQVTYGTKMGTKMRQHVSVRSARQKALNRSMYENHS
jgi:hypothetical protein